MCPPLLLRRRTSETQLMDITFVTHVVSAGPDDSVGGAQRSLHTVASGLADRGHSVTVLTAMSAANSISITVNYEIIEVRDELPPVTEQLDYVVPRICREYENQTDVFHVFEPQFLPGGARYRHRGGTPVVGRLNAYGTFCYNKALMNGDCHKQCNALKRFKHFDGSSISSGAHFPQMLYADNRTGSINRYDSLCALSPTVKDIYREVGITEPPIDVVPNMYDPDFPESGSMTDPLDSDAVDVLFVGRLTGEKGVKILLDAMDGLKLPSHLHVIGDGAEADTIRAYADNLPVACTFYGRVDNSALYPFYEHADVFVHPGTWPEPGGRVILEALQAGTPLIVSDIGAPPWIAGDACLTFKRNESMDLRSQLQTLLTTDNRRDELVSNAAEELERFEPQSVIQRYEEIYTRIYQSND